MDEKGRRITKAEIAEKVGVTERTLERWPEEEWPPHFRTRTGRVWAWERQVDAFVNSTMRYGGKGPT